MGSIINVTPKSYVEYESVENWAGEFAEYITEKHKNAPVLDHPDGCVTESKLSQGVRAAIAETVGKAQTATETAGIAKSTADAAIQTAGIAKTTADTAKNDAEIAKRDSGNALSLAQTAEIDAGKAILRAESALTAIPKKVSELENDSEYITVPILSDATYSLYQLCLKDINELWDKKTDKPTITSMYFADFLFEFASMYNKEMRLAGSFDGTLDSLSFTFGNGEYQEDYISGLSFNSGETPTAVDYTDSGILNWIGTDTSTFTYQINPEGDIATISLFIPSPNTHYDIVFYFNGAQFIGLVNGYVPASGNEAV